MEPEESKQSSLRTLFDGMRKRLVETGTRNRLIHVNRANTRGHMINIVNERSDDVYAILSSGKSMRFHPTGKNKEQDREGVQLSYIDDEKLDQSRFKDSLLETKLGSEELHKKLLRISREAKTAEEEQGVNILYLALGFLSWFEDQNSSVVREAPLVLLPVELTRSARGASFDLRLRDDDLFTNLPLQQRLKNDFGIRIPEIDNGEDEWAPSSYFEAVRKAVSSQERWTIEPDGMQLGFFSFAKLLMYLDLDPDAWPENGLEKHSLSRGLLFERFPEETPLFDERTKLDDILPPENLFHVVDADASQAKVIEEARAGRNLVVQGPPGTGKSQTITNIIAAAAREGKTVLFVAEKMAALSVVHDRLVKHGLEHICLELHSKNSNKKAVLGEIARTLHAAAAKPLPSAPVELTETRDRLNRIATVLHATVPGCDESPFTALGKQIRYIGREAPPPRLSQNGLAELPRAKVKELVGAISTYGSLVEACAQRSPNPYRGSTNLNLQPLDVQRLEANLSKAVAHVRALSAEIKETSEWLGVAIEDRCSAVPSLVDQLTRLADMPAIDKECMYRILANSEKQRLRETLQLGEAWVSARRRLEGTFIELAFETSVASLRGALVAGQHSLFARWGSAYRRASRELAGLLRGALPKAPAERLSLVDDLLDEHRSHERLRSEESFCASALGPKWRGDATDFGLLYAAVAWAENARGSIGAADANIVQAAGDYARAKRHRDHLERGLGKSIAALDGISETLGLGGLTNEPLTVIADRLGAMADESDRYSEWVALSRARTILVDAGLGELADRIDSGELDGASAATEFDFARAEAVWKRALETLPGLATIRELDRHALAELFAKLERNHLRENAEGIVAQHLAQLPRGAMGEMGVIRAEIAKRRRHMPLRKLFTVAGTALQRIKPVMLMSPISVAQFLPPGAMEFDLLVIDEASQVRPEDALGAIARAKQIVVVGDQKQLPPTSFFDRLLADGGVDDDAEDEEAQQLLGHAAAAGEMESILSLCEARGMGCRMLEWHYRSRDPSLIRVSNKEFYRDRLILPPSPLQGDPQFGLCFTRVNGVYARGGKRDNRLEGEAVVARVAEHARARPELSLGIVTFSSSQRNLITELLELARRFDHVLDEFLREGKAEDVFVKNIENVQGDERDVILISVGYGPSTPGGRLANMTFGPVNLEGGERRLNVLFTRARVRCEVFASFDPADIDVARTSRDGPKILKRFLEFAAHGTILEAAPSGEQPETPFEEEVADVIRSFGYLADPQVGSAGFRIDLGVRHPDRPGRYILAVECDGSTYHSALWARERDRLRQEILEHLGWRFHRIWSTDWFYNRHGEIERLRNALAIARERAEAGLSVRGANVDPPAVRLQIIDFSESLGSGSASERKMPPYRRFSYRCQSSMEPHEVDRDTLASLAGRVIDEEGPIHLEEIARRIASSYGKEKAGSRIVQATREALSLLKRSNGSIRCEGDFWFTAAQSENPPVRDRSAETGATIKAASLSLLEIEAALRLALEDCGGASDAELVRSAARLLGFRRVGSDLQARISEALSRIR